MKSYPIFMSVTLSVALAVFGSKLAESASSPSSLIPEDLKPLIETAKDIAGVLSGATSAITLLQLVGLIPTDISIEEAFEQLQADLERIGSVIFEHQSALVRADQLANAITAAHEAERAAAETPPRRLEVDIPADFESEAAVNYAFTPELFERLNIESVNDGGTFWKWIIPGPATPGPSFGFGPPFVYRDTSDTVYDWRLNMPHLMYIIALRLKVMTAIHPEWRVDGYYDLTSLKPWAEGLDRHLKKMLSDVRCGFKINAIPNLLLAPTNYDVYTWVGCADISTGISSVQMLPQRRGFGTNLVPILAPGGSNCFPDFNFDLERCISTLQSEDPSFFNELISIQETAYREVVRQMPIFEIQSMIDTLNFYLSHARDLTASNRRIPFETVTDYCLTVQSGNPDSGTPVVLSTCTGDVAQRWEYDRESGQIRNPWADKCLDVPGANPMAGTPVQIWDCNETDAQKWTYDPVTHVLQSAVSTVLTVPRPAFAALLSGPRGLLLPLVMSWSSDYPAAISDLVLPEPRSQQWHADPVTFEVPAVWGMTTRVISPFRGRMRPPTCDRASVDMEELRSSNTIGFFPH
jgi:hypothetical protein